ncbi:MAG TPA: hypothetical protein GXX31_05850 [Methanothermobacter sp.]|jgi:Flp pilus assembly pilin Flp|uniref:Class III signal peptide-containing protein n=1 Tax=Methanothermobacter tenebrarum TaxID=680118 RepID=A0ABM7YC06_9EURY|nr:hypothetical protein [Methanothermobacter tenebrarum]MDD3454164.1 hypothetical protein [Methanobacteriales archaeon]MDX9693425.1 hypothetical protein [Methanothermobacter sp.]BDH78974.1 hypothetical protein MTTB_03530 [Methanothermobacter tenebrarum]HHW16877.1 hypothetical protein [Methanothermobacter sp.]HOQ20582.1 hypothetical protein [Methanothermobacter sp.]
MNSRDESGQAMTEYLLVLILVIILAIITVLFISPYFKGQDLSSAED